MSIQSRILELGLSYHYLKNFNQNINRPPIILNSIPKSGTNLLMRFLLLTGLYRRAISKTLVEETQLSNIERYNGTITLAHLPLNERNAILLSKYASKHILMVRHPFDIAISNLHYIKSTRSSHRLTELFDQLPSDTSRLQILLNGNEGTASSRPVIPLSEQLRSFWEWSNYHEPPLIIRFEDIVGTLGGGDYEAQKRAATKIENHLDIKVDLNSINLNLFSKQSRTFRNGKIYGYLNEDIQLKKLLYGDPKLLSVCDLLGYRLN